jgi:hypothetical protein
MNVPKLIYTAHVVKLDVAFETPIGIMRIVEVDGP